LDGAADCSDGAADWSDAAAMAAPQPDAAASVAGPVAPVPLAALWDAVAVRPDGSYSCYWVPTSTTRLTDSDA
jgi:hypothetical protein